MHVKLFLGQTKIGTFQMLW